MVSSGREPTIAMAVFSAYLRRSQAAAAPLCGAGFRPVRDSPAGWLTMKVGSLGSVQRCANWDSQLLFEARMQRNWLPDRIFPAKISGELPTVECLECPSLGLTASSANLMWQPSQLAWFRT